MFNKLCRIGNDPEVRFIPSGDAVLSLSLAYAYGRKGSDGKRPTQWLEAAIWGKQAEAVAQYLKKGDQISVSVDDLHIETYKKKDQSEGFKLAGKIVLFDFVGSKQQGESHEVKPEYKAEPAKTNFDNFDDDIPF
jgi:single-strand DNA-binding protein